MKAQDIADLLGAKIHGNGDMEIDRVAALDTAREGDLAFVEKVNARGPSTGASCVIVPLGFEMPGVTVIEATDPKLAFAQAAAALQKPTRRGSGIHPTAVIATSADISLQAYIGPHTSIGDRTSVGSGTQILAGTVVGDSVKIGRNCVLHPGVVIEDNCSIGNNVVLHAKVVIGGDGFGYVRADAGYVKFPQIGTVVIEDDVEIGANSCIDRGALGETRIGCGTKIDNLVQIAHNVTIGKRVIIAAQTGISGSSVVEDDCVIGGQVGMGDHATIKSGAVIGSQAGVLPGKIVRQGIWWGTPVQPLNEYKRQNAHVKGLARLKEEVASLKATLKKSK